MAVKLPKLNKTQVLFLIFTIAIMCTIFCLSHQDAERSSDTSSFLTKVAVKILYSNYDSEPPEVQKELWSKASFIVRKLAHFSIYASLGFCASVTAGRRRLFSAKSLGVIGFGFIYAMSDEFHQHFIPGRSCELRDMMIDTGGVTVGMCISLIFMGIIALFVRKRRKNKE
ncbi:VanZ family protein [Ruminococcus sp.]|uniref:VanZ family protein n=1 Tax=Ruminococcus sp. TaxID=41978 RepID=UPI0025F36574|nr:VanZ family protein [Ruminococcus sp.]MCR4639613.1 VanZ family protein [Ruminococcus sp.]